MVSGLTERIKGYLVVDPAEVGRYPYPFAVNFTAMTTNKYPFSSHTLHSSL